MSYAANDGGIFIYSIQSGKYNDFNTLYLFTRVLGSAADRCQVLEVGDQIIQVDSTSFEHLTNDQCLALLKKASNDRRFLSL